MMIMNGPAYFWFSLIRYLVCVECVTVLVATSVVNPIGNEGAREKWKLLEQPSNSQLRQEERKSEWVQRRVNGNLFKKFNDLDGDGPVLFSAEKCSRYCIQKDINTHEDDLQYINLFWTANGIEIPDKPLANDRSQLSSKTEWIDTQDSDINPRNCQIYLDLDCNIVEVGTMSSNDTKRGFHSSEENSGKNGDGFKRSTDPNFRTPIKIAEEQNLSEQTQTKFLVNNAIRRIIINIDGNVTNALLQVPTASRQRTAISWTRKGNADGVRIDTRNAPPGEWRMKLVGDDNSKYRFTAEGFLDQKSELNNLFFPNPRLNGNLNGDAINDHSNIKTKNDLSADKKIFNDRIKTINSKMLAAEQQNLDISIEPNLMENEKNTPGRSLRHRSTDREENNQLGEENLNNSSIISSSTENVLVNFVEFVTLVDTDKDVTASSNNSSEKLLERTFITKEQETVRARSSIGATENLDVDIRAPMQKTNNTSMRMIETLDNRGVSEEIMNYVNDNTNEEKKMLIEVNRNSNLLVTPGTIHRVVFDVTNNCVLPVRYAFRVKSTPFRLFNTQPPYAWIYPGQMSNVAIDLIVPDNVAPDTANTVTLYILGTEIKEKSVYLYVQGSLSKITDDVKPTTEYYFNNNCAGRLEKDRCYKSRWSVDITIQDYDSGLKRVISSPNNIYPRTEFISGTRSPVTFFYSATCCDKTAKITAIDLLDNYNTLTLDVTAWNNLSEAEIAAITVGALFTLLLIVLVVILIIYCVRRRKSHDFPYTQRYGSRPPAQSERTNF